MRKGGLCTQAAVLACSNCVTRALGFILRAVLSRMMGAEAMGVMALAQNVQMLLIAPSTAGLPMAVSRMTARGENAVRAGERLSVRAGLLIALLYLPFVPVIARLMPDSRVLPSLVLYAPCALVLGLSGVHNGFCHSRGNAIAPAVGGLAEQVLRFALSATLLLFLPRMTVAGRAAVPALATVLAEVCGLCLVGRMIRKDKRAFEENAAPVKQGTLARAALPLCLSRLVTTLARAVQGMLVPALLVRAGADAGEAASAYGRLAGMALPLLFLPGMATGAIAVVSAPALAARQHNKTAARALIVRALLSALAAGGAGALCLFFGARQIAERAYAQPALAELLRLLAPGALFIALQQAASALLIGLGKQKHAFTSSLTGALMSLALTALWTGDPAQGIAGAARAMLFGQAAGALTGLCLLGNARAE